MFISELANKAPAPLASRHIDRDTAKRWRAFPADLCEVRGDDVLVPMYLVTGATQSMLGVMYTQIQDLKRDIAVLNGYGAPIEASTSQPMISLVTTERAKSTYSPLSVPGNEAEDLSGAMSLPPLSSKDDTHPKGEVVKPTEYRKSNVVPLHLPNGNNYTPAVAANDSTSEQVETAQKTDTITVIDGGHGILDGLAEAYGMTVEEASGILFNENEKRDRHCRQLYDGKSRADVQLSRILAKLPNQSVQSGYLVWSYQKQRDVPTPVVEFGTYRQPMVVIRQARAEARRKNDIKERLGWSKVAWNNALMERIAARATPPDVRTTRSQLKAVRSWFNDRVDTFQRWLGLTTLDRAQRLRDNFEKEDLVIAKRNPAKAGTTHVDPLSLTTGELVRLANRQGISH